MRREKSTGIDPVEILRSLLTDMNQSEIARQVGCSPQLIERILKRRQAPGPMVLAYLGIERVVTPVHYRIIPIPRRTNGQSPPPAAEADSAA